MSENGTIQLNNDEKLGQSYTFFLEEGGLSYRLISPNIAWPLTLRTSPSDYAKFNIKIKSFFDILSVCFWKEKNSKRFSLYVFTAEQGWISAKIGKCC